MNARSVLTCLAGALACGGVPAQGVTPRAFLPRDYSAELRIDMAGIVDSGVWDAVERSFLRVGLASFRTRLGFDVADLDRVRFAQRVDPAPDGRPDWERRTTQVWILEGSDRVGTTQLGPDLLEGTTPTRVDDVTVFGSDYGAEFASPAPGVFVHARVVGQPYSDADDSPPVGLVTATLRGARRGGAPVPELVALTAAPRALIVFAGVATTAMPMGPENLSPLPEWWFDPEDLPVGLRIMLTREDGGDALSLEMLVRFEGGAGVRRMSEAFDSTVAELAADPSTRGFAQLLGQVHKSVSGSDLTLALDLGEERQAAPKFSQLLTGAGPLLWLAVADVQPPQPMIHVVDVAEAVEEEEPPVEEPPAEKKKKD